MSSHAPQTGPCQADPYLHQQQSPLFRIPRELRDTIYEYYVYEEDGYVHDIGTGKLALSGNNPIQLDLTYTCRAIGAEMTGVALRTNKVTFKAGGLEDNEGFYGFCSRAGRFKLLQDRVTCARCQLLDVVGECVTQTIIDETIQKFGDDGRYLVESFRATRNGLLRPMRNAVNILGPWYFWSGNLSVGRRNALQHMLLLCSSHPDFECISQRIFDRNINDARNPAWGTLFRHDALSMILHWQPVPWEIPSASELHFMESFIVFAEEEMCKGVPRFMIWTAFSVRWFFSACAVAINYLDCHPSERSQMRNIVVKEDFKSVSNPECHASGLIRFCQENPKLRIERHVGLWDSLFPPHWHDLPFPGDGLMPPSRRGTPVSGTLFPHIFEWFMKANALAPLMSSKSFRFVFDGRSSYDFKIWTLVLRVASLQEGMLEQQRQGRIHLPLAFECRDYLHRPWPLPCHLSAGFSGVIKSIQQGNSPIIDFRGYSGELWDLESVFATRMMWTNEQWYSEWNMLNNQRIMTPQGDTNTSMINLVRGYLPG